MRENGLTSCGILGVEMPERHQFAWLYRETISEIARQEKLACEGKDLEASLRLANYVLNSGLVPILKAYSQDVPVKIDGAHLQWRAEELQRTVRAFYVGQGHKPKIEMSEIESINHKLDLIAGYVAGLGNGTADSHAREAG